MLFNEIRELLRQIGAGADVPIEPRSQSELIEASLAVAGVLVAGVPGGKPLPSQPNPFHTNPLSAVYSRRIRCRLCSLYRTSLETRATDAVGNLAAGCGQGARRCGRHPRPINERLLSPLKLRSSQTSGYLVKLYLPQTFTFRYLFECSHGSH